MTVYVKNGNIVINNNVVSNDRRTTIDANNNYIELDKHSLAFLVIDESNNNMDPISEVIFGSITPIKTQIYLTVKNELKGQLISGVTGLIIWYENKQPSLSSKSNLKTLNTKNKKFEELVKNDNLIGFTLVESIIDNNTHIIHGLTRTNFSQNINIYKLPDWQNNVENIKIKTNGKLIDITNDNINFYFLVEYDNNYSIEYIKIKETYTTLSVTNNLLTVLDDSNYSNLEYSQDNIIITKNNKIEQYRLTRSDALYLNQISEFNTNFSIYSITFNDNMSKMFVSTDTTLYQYIIHNKLILYSELDFIISMSSIKNIKNIKIYKGEYLYIQEKKKIKLCDIRFPVNYLIEIKKIEKDKAVANIINKWY